MSSDDEETLPPAEPDAALNLPALFWDHVPEGAEQHADYAAMQALAEESTPEERAENFKARGCRGAVNGSMSRHAVHAMCLHLHNLVVLCPLLCYCT